MPSFIVQTFTVALLFFLSACSTNDMPDTRIKKESDVSEQNNSSFRMVQLMVAEKKGDSFTVEVTLLDLINSTQTKISREKIKFTLLNSTTFPFEFLLRAQSEKVDTTFHVDPDAKNPPDYELATPSGSLRVLVLSSQPDGLEIQLLIRAFPSERTKLLNKVLLATRFLATLKKNGAGYELKNIRYTKTVALDNPEKLDPTVELNPNLYMDAVVIP